ncbi:hypothetical protein QC764_105700 [Podospora pseudoanserina]|uniref:Transporter n=1 Tax=Podospora pseudoanserina TaxID=2609844 RepID=A0ABR0ILG3_9PEZI|nr:hypothetical protein QC764_105700 [Podospora pseudoanserina]
MADTPPPPITSKANDDPPPLNNVPSESTARSTGISFGPDLRGDIGPSQAGGIYNTRSITRVSFDRRTAGDISQENGGPSNSSDDVEEGDDWRDKHGKTKQVFKGTTLLWLAYQSIGVIYGDIGTRYDRQTSRLLSGSNADPQG